MARAAVLSAQHQPLEVREVELAPLADRGVRVAIAACGVCHTDLSVQDGTLGVPTPCVLGHEGAGVVVEKGRAVTRVDVGDHVALTLLPPCRSCWFCLRGLFIHCQRGFGELADVPYAAGADAALHRAFGTSTFAEETVVHERSVVPIDADVPFDVAALIGCGVVTGVGAVLNSARVEPGSAVAVLGCGGVGISVIMGAVLAGATTVIAIDRLDAKLEVAESFGATHACRADDATETVRALTGGRGVDVAFEVVGRSDTIAQAYALTRPAGMTIVVGGGRADDMVALSAQEIMRYEKVLRGSAYGSADPDRDFSRIVSLYRSGRLPIDKLISRRIALDEIDDAFRAMTAGETIRSVVML